MRKLRSDRWNREERNQKRREQNEKNQISRSIQLPQGVGSIPPQRRLLSQAVYLGTAVVPREKGKQKISGDDRSAEHADRIDHRIERRKEMKREYVITITASYDDLVETETNLRRARKIAKDWLKDKDVKSVSIDRWTHDEFGEECIDDSFDEEYYDKED